MSGLMTKPENESIEIKMDTPRNIVEQLDRYIVGQADAKRAVAIAIRNRWRRQQLPDELQQEISPKNIMMIGPTGVGENGDRAAACETHGRSLYQGRSNQVHRGRILRARCGKHGPRTG